jgi:hypothetical protein
MRRIPQDGRLFSWRNRFILAGPGWEGAEICAGMKAAGYNRFIIFFLQLPDTFLHLP